MELLQGHDLHEEVARARIAGELLPWARSKKIFLQICAALSAAHARGIIHRDLKPENVYLVDFLGEPDFVKLLDFGIAKLTEVNEEGRKLTKTGMLFGTPEYMSPEQARGEQVDHRVDVYAMGCILFQLVTGRVPFEADNFMGVLSQHLTEPAPGIPEAVFDRIGAPRELAAVIDRALAKDRTKRWLSFDDLANGVRAVCGEPVLEAGRSTAGVTAVRPASVPAPAVTKEARAATPPPDTLPPAGGVVEGRQRTQWTGRLAVPVDGDEPHRGRSKLPFVLGAIAVAAAAAVAVFFATRDNKAGSGVAVIDSGVAVNPTPDAHVVVPPIADAAVIVQPPVPDESVITITSEPAGADVFELAPTSIRKGKTPLTLKVPGSRTPRTYLARLRNHSDEGFSIVPELPAIERRIKLTKGTAIGPGSGSATGSNSVGPGSGSGSGVAVRPPDVKPDAGVSPPDECDDPPCIKRKPRGMGCSATAECEAGLSCTDGTCQ
jgi:serine/threonine-protein kinase